jgi:hypothetical protein
MASFTQNAYAQLATIMNSDSWLKRCIMIVGVVIIMGILLSIGSKILAVVLKPSNPYIVNGMVTGTRPKTVKMDAVNIERSDNQAGGLEFTWAVWLNITSLDPGGSQQYKHIFSKGNNDNVPDPLTVKQLVKPINAPGLFIDPTTNALLIVMNTFETIDETVRVDSIPLNKWINVIIRVRGVQLDVYVNGLVVKSVKLESVPRQNNGDVFISQNGGFNGYLSNLRYYNYALEPGDILAIAEKGPSLVISKLESNDLKSSGQYLSLQWYFQ